MNHRRLLISGRARGFTLVEALVSLLVLSVGLLGVAALQLSSLRSNHGSSLRTQATFLAYDIIDRMRANRTAALDGAYNIAIDAADPAAGSLANNDLRAWRANIARALPGGDIDGDSDLEPATGSVAFDAGTRVFTITIVWDESHSSDSAPGTQVARFTMDTRLD